MKREQIRKKKPDGKSKTEKPARSGEQKPSISLVRREREGQKKRLAGGSQHQTKGWLAR